jgi:mono/diheme cytochrome c family protein
MGDQTKYVAWAISVTLVGGLAYAGQDSQNGSALAEEGRTIYTRQCSRCHGYNMINNGLVGFDLRKFPRDDQERFINSVSRGKPPKMPPWGDVLSSSEIEALWAYVQTGGTP